MASSEATAWYQPAPGRTDGIPDRDQRQWIKIRLYKFLAGTSKEQVLDKGIKQNSTVPFVRGYRTVTPWIPRNNCVYTRQPTQWHATSDVLTRLPAKTQTNRNACLDALRSAFQQKIASLYGIRCELVNKKNVFKFLIFILNKENLCHEAKNSVGK